MPKDEITLFEFPAAPASAATAAILTAMTGPKASKARRIVATIRSSHDSGASGLTFEAIYGTSTTYRAFYTATHLAATASDPTWTYDLAVPLGAAGLRVQYVNSANSLTSWEGSIGVIYDERTSG